MAKSKEKRLIILGERLNKLRGELSQAEFSKRIGITAATIGYYENSERLPDAETLHKICAACNVSSDYLLGLSDVAERDINAQAASERYGLSEAALQTLERLTATQSINKAERGRIISKQRKCSTLIDLVRQGIIYPTEEVYSKTVSDLSLTKAEAEIYPSMALSAYNECLLTALNDLLTAKTGIEQETQQTFGEIILENIYNFCRKKFEKVEISMNGPTGRVINHISPDEKRDIEVIRLNRTLSEMRQKIIESEAAKNGKNK